MIRPSKRQFSSKIDQNRPLKNQGPCFCCPMHNAQEVLPRKSLKKKNLFRPRGISHRISHLNPSHTWHIFAEEAHWPGRIWSSNSAAALHHHSSPGISRASRISRMRLPVPATSQKWDSLPPMLWSTKQLHTWDTSIILLIINQCDVLKN